MEVKARLHHDGSHEKAENAISVGELVHAREKNGGITVKELPLRQSSRENPHGEKVWAIKGGTQPVGGGNMETVRM